MHVERNIRGLRTLQELENAHLFLAIIVYASNFSTNTD